MKKTPSIIKKILIGLGALIVMAFIVGTVNNTFREDKFDVLERSTDLSGDLNSVMHNEGATGAEASYNVLSGAISITRVKGPAYAQANGNSYEGFCKNEAPKQAGGTKFNCLDSEKEYRISAKIQDDVYICTSHNIDSGIFAKLEKVTSQPSGYKCK